MAILSPAAQADFVSKFYGAAFANVRPNGLSKNTLASFTQKLNDTDDNEAVAVFNVHKSPTALLSTTLWQKETGRLFASIDFAADTPEEFHAMLKMVTDGIDAVAAEALSSNWRNNNLPTLTSFSGSVATGAVSTPIEVTLAAMKTAGNEADSGGTVEGFVVQAVSTGTLKIGPTLATAKDYAKADNDTIDGINKAFWTSAGGASGATNAFTVKAKDNNGWLSATAVQAQVTIS